jgi:hypothetical protein
MQPDRWRRVEELYHAVMEQEKGQRAAFLESSCAGDETLRVEVESLVAYGQQGGRIIDQPALDVVAGAMAEDLRAEGAMTADKMTGARIAQYRIVLRTWAGQGRLSRQRNSSRRRWPSARSWWKRTPPI